MTAASTAGAPRVTFVALNYAPSTGGAQELVRRIAEGLVARGAVVDIVTSDAMRSPTAEDPGRIERKQERIDGVDVHRFGSFAPVTEGLRAVRRIRGRLGWGRGSARLVGPWSLGLTRAVRRAVRTSDVVVGCSAPFSTVLLPASVRRGGRASIISMPLLHDSPTALHRRLQDALRRSDRVVAMTRHEADQLAEIGVAAERVSVIPPGTDVGPATGSSPAEARALVGLPERPTVGFIGRLASYKGIDTLLDAAPAIWVEHPDTTVLIAGSPTGWDGYRSSEVEAEGGDRFVIREGFPHDEREALMRACDVVVHPSRHESFGMIAIEAWAAERPVVLADIACVRSFVDDGRTGELVPPGDHEALARSINGLLADPERRAALAATGRAEAEAAYDWERICDQWFDVVRSCAGAR